MSLSAFGSIGRAIELVCWEASESESWSKINDNVGNWNSFSSYCMQDQKILSLDMRLKFFLTKIPVILLLSSWSDLLDASVVTEGAVEVADGEVKDDLVTEKAVDERSPLSEIY